MSIEKINQGDQLTQSMDLVQENIQRLKELFPEIVTEGKIDFNVLQEVLGNELEQGEEYYRFTWAGKVEARREAHKTSTGTLRPCKEESVNWDTTENLYIEGDNLEVLKSLQKSYANKVKMIYIDPPYNTGQDFVYKDNYKDNLKNYQQITGQIDNEGNRVTSNSDSDGRYHSNWLNMMYPRLKLARNFLKEDGAIFISIDDNEVENLKKLCNEIFGEENFYATFIWQKRSGSMDSVDGTSTDHEYVLCYGKRKTRLKGIQRTFEKYKNPDNDLRGPWIADNLSAGKAGGDVFYEITDPETGNTFFPPKGRFWPYNPSSMSQKISENRILFPKESTGRPMLKRFQYEAMSNFLPVSSLLRNYTMKDVPNNALVSALNTKGTAEIEELFNGKIFSFPKSTILLKSLMSQVISNNSDDIILDFFSGSSTTAHAVMELNAQDDGSRKFILVQLPELTNEKSEAFQNGYKIITEIGKERIRRAGGKIKDEKSAEIEKLKTKNSLLEEDKEEIDNLQTTVNNLDTGFKVFKLDSSNIKGWDGNPNELENSLFDSQDNIKTDRTEEDVLFEIMLKYGLDLTLPIEEKLFEGKKVFNVGLGGLFICLADGITSKVAEGIGEWKQQLQPETCRVIFKDSGFTDVEKTNSVQILKRFGITEVKSI